MFGLGMQELIVILIVALIVIGPGKLPDLARGLGKALREFRRATDDIRNGFDLNHPDTAARRSTIKTAHTSSGAPETTPGDTPDAPPARESDPDSQ
jgi:TatA/E family protein of Tat protein translocase